MIKTSLHITTKYHYKVRCRVAVSGPGSLSGDHEWGKYHQINFTAIKQKLQRNGSKAGFGSWNSQVKAWISIQLRVCDRTRKNAAHASPLSYQTESGLSFQEWRKIAAQIYSPWARPEGSTTQGGKSYLFLKISVSVDDLLTLSHSYMRVISCWS